MVKVKKPTGILQNPVGVFKPSQGFSPTFQYWGKTLGGGGYKKINIKNLSRNKYV